MDIEMFESTGPHGADSPRRPLEISGCIESTDADLTALNQCRVEVFFELKAPDEVIEPRLELVILRTRDSSPARTDRRSVSTRTDSQGNFKVSIPDRAELASTRLHFSVWGPAGQLIGDMLAEATDIPELLIIPVITKDSGPILLEVPANLARTKMRRIAGQVLDRMGKSIPANSQVLLFAHEFGDTRSDAMDTPILITRTDASGHFFGEVPNKLYRQAAALVGGIATEISIVLDDRLIPSRLPLVVDIPQSTDLVPKGDDCGCDVTPRTPSQADIENAPETYSTDLGTGRCVQFNTPNRAIEEFDFYTVVRTTEPGIVGFTAAGDPMAGSAPSDALLTTIAPAASAAASAEAAKAIAAIAAREAADAEALAKTAEVLASGFDLAQRSDPVETTVKAVLIERRSPGWTANVANQIVTQSLVAAGIPLLSAIEVAKTVVAAVAEIALEVVFSTNLDVITAAVRKLLTAAAERPAAAAKAAREAAIAAAAKASSTAAAAAASVTIAAAAEAAKAAEIAARAKALEAAARAQLEARITRNKPEGRQNLNKDNPIDWDETPTFYQAAEIAHGHLLHFKQVWYADGYSLGDLLYSLPLAPGQKKLISVVDWERRERTERIEDTFSSENVNAALARDRDLGEVVTGALTEGSRGGSKSTSAGVGAGGGGAGNGSYQGFNFGALIGVSGGYGESNSDAWQASARNLSSSSLQNLRDRTLQSASAIRSLRSSVVHTVAQGEAVRATTEVVANHNHCHAVTIQYFEVLRHLKLQHELADVQECLFVPLPMSGFGLAKALRWRQALQTYLQRPELAGGFDAARRVETAWSQVDSPLERYADERVVSLAGELLITVLIPLPPFPERPKPRPEDSAATTAQAIADAVNPTTGALGVFLAIATGGVSLVAAAATTSTINATKEAAKGARALADELYAETNPQERYAKFHRDIVPGVVEGFINQLELWALVEGKPALLDGVDFTLASEYQPGIPLLVSLRATIKGQYQRSHISQLIVKSANGLPPTFRAIVNSATIRYRTATFEHSFVDDARVNDDIDPPKAVAIFAPPPNIGDYEIQKFGSGGGAALFTPIDAWEQRSPRKDDQRLAAELVEHLNDNLEYYHHAIWWTMDPNRRYMLLDGYHAPGSNSRSVASVVENRLIGIIGNSVVLPVARGNHLNPRFVPKPDKNGKTPALVDYYKLDSPVQAARVSLPTRGVFAEAVMGSCNACEEIDDSKFWRWEESPIDEPPLIEPISTGTRRGEPGPVLPTSFPTPIVSIQNAPSAPDPAGVRGVLEALGKQSFPDITGLAATQANAAAAYKQALDTASTFGKEASTLAQQAAMLGAKDKALGAIDSAEDQGKIDASDAKQLRLTALKKMVGETPVDAKAASVTDRLKVVEEQVAKGVITREKGAELSEQIMKGLDPEDARKNEEQKAATETIRRIPGEAVEVVETKDASGATTTVKARPSGKAGTPAVVGVERIVLFVPQYPDSNNALFGWYDFGISEPRSQQATSNSFLIREGSTIGRMPVRLPAGLWGLQGRIQAQIPASTLTVPVKVIPGVDPFEFTAQADLVGTLIPFDISGTIDCKPSAKVIEVHIKPQFDTVTVNREIELSLGATGSAQVTTEAKAAVEAEGNAHIVDVTARGELAFGTQYTLTGTATAGQKLTLTIVYKHLKGFELTQK